MTIYSHSRLSTFEQCAFKYKCKYIDQLDPDYKQSIEGFLGNQVHDTLEWIYNNPEKEKLELDTVIQYFIEKWNKEFSSEIRIIKPDLTQEFYFNKGIKFLINYFMKHKPFKDNTIATEKKIFINLNQSGTHRLIGFIDRLVHDKDKNIFEIHDYKTSASIKSQEELDRDRQLALYSIAIWNEYNPNDVHLKWHFLDFNQILTSKRTYEQLENLKKEIISLINKIESTIDFPPNLGILCNWCEFQSKCPDFQRNIHEIKLTPNNINNNEKQVSLGDF